MIRRRGGCCGFSNFAVLAGCGVLLVAGVFAIGLAIGLSQVSEGELRTVTVTQASIFHTMLVTGQHADSMHSSGSLQSAFARSVANVTSTKPEQVEIENVSNATESEGEGRRLQGRRLLSVSKVLFSIRLRSKKATVVEESASNIVAAILQNEEEFAGLVSTEMKAVIEYDPFLAAEIVQEFGTTKLGLSVVDDPAGEPSVKVKKVSKGGESGDDKVVVPTAGATPSSTPSNTPSSTPSSTTTPTPSVTPSSGSSPSPTPSSTLSPTPSPSSTPPPTPSPSTSSTPSQSPTPSPTPSSSSSPASSPSTTPSPSTSPSTTPTTSATPSSTAVSTPSSSSSPTPSPPSTPSPTSSPSTTPSPGSSPSTTPSPTPTSTPTPTPSSSSTPSPTPTPSATPVSCDVGEEGVGGECVKCGAGRFGVAASQECMDCPPGSASATLGAVNASACTMCLPGRYSPSTGQAHCSVCTPGSFAPSSNATSCSQCPLHHFSSTSAASSCTPCPTNTHTTSKGSSSCSPCPPHHVTSSPGSPCTPCPPLTLLLPHWHTCSPDPPLALSILALLLFFLLSVAAFLFSRWAAAYQQDSFEHRALTRFSTAVFWLGVGLADSLSDIALLISLALANPPSPTPLPTTLFWIAAGFFALSSALSAFFVTAVILTDSARYHSTPPLCSLTNAPFLLLTFLAALLNVSLLPFVPAGFGWTVCHRHSSSENETPRQQLEDAAYLLRAYTKILENVPLLVVAVLALPFLPPFPTAVAIFTSALSLLISILVVRYRWNPPEEEEGTSMVPHSTTSRRRKHELV